MRLRPLPAVLLLACWSFSARAAFDLTDVVQIQASHTLAHDNNLYRLPPNYVPPVDPFTGIPLATGVSLEKKADSIRTTTVGLKIDKRISRQHLIADVALSESTYDKNTNLDFFGGNARVAWAWQLGNNWSGEGSYLKRRTLGGFSDFRQSIQDLINTEAYTFNGGYRIHPRWRISGELSSQDGKHSAATRRTLDYSDRTAGITLSYRTPAENSLALQVRRSEGHSPNRESVGLFSIDNSHTETRVSAIAAWRLTGSLSLDGHLGRAEREHEQLHVRDFSGVIWRAAGNWDATAKFRLTVSASKDIRTYEDVSASYVSVTGVRFSPTYAITPKLVLQGDFSHETRDYRGDPGSVLLASPAREDRLRIARVIISYSPLRNVDLSLSYEGGDRRSTHNLNGIDNSFDYQGWSGTARLSF